MGWVADLECVSFRHTVAGAYGRVWFREDGKAVRVSVCECVCVCVCVHAYVCVLEGELCQNGSQECVSNDYPVCLSTKCGGLYSDKVLMDRGSEPDPKKFGGRDL